MCVFVECAKDITRIPQLPLHNWYCNWSISSLCAHLVESYHSCRSGVGIERARTRVVRANWATGAFFLEPIVTLLHGWNSTPWPGILDWHHTPGMHAFRTIYPFCMFLSCDNFFISSCSHRRWRRTRMERVKWFFVFTRCLLRFSCMHAGMLFVCSFVLV